VTWGGVELRVYDGATLLSSVAATPSPISLNIPNPAAATTVTARLVSFDVNNRTNSEVAGTPQNTLNIGSATGTLDLRKYLPASSDLFAITGGKIVVAANQITETAIASGSISTPKLQANAITSNEIAANAVVAGKIATNAVTATTILANAVTTAKLDATEISVGGGGSKPGKFGVYNASGSQIGFIGVESGNEGGWLKTLSVGGTSYNTGMVRADGSGNVTINGATLTLNLNSTVAEIANGAAFGYNNGLRVYSTTSGQESPVMIAPGVIQIGNTLTTGTKFFLNGSFGANTSMNVYDSNAAERVRLTAFTSGAILRLYGSSTSFATYASDSVALLSGGSFSVGSATGVTSTTSPLTSISVSTASYVTGINTNFVTINYKDHSNNNQTVSFLAFASTTTANAVSSIGSSTTTLAFTGGIRTT
jgi:hypothetical protein